MDLTLMKNSTFWLKPLFKHTPGQYRGCVRFFNTNSSNGKMGMHNLVSILEKHGIKATHHELNLMIAAISVNSKHLTQK